MTKFVPKIMVVMRCQSWADGIEMNKRILLSPVLEVANEKLAFFGEDARQDLWSHEISRWDPPRPWLLPGEED